MKTRKIHEIALEIWDKWPNVKHYAMPYLQAMLQLSDINDKYGMDSAKSIIAYFLSNAATFKGEDAKRLKAELKELIK